MHTGQRCRSSCTVDWSQEAAEESNMSNVKITHCSQCVHLSWPAAATLYCAFIFGTGPSQGLFVLQYTAIMPLVASESKVHVHVPYT